MIDFIGVSKHFGTQDIFNDVSFRINQGERVGIVGPNGAGKSTIFQLLTEEISPDKGDVIVPKKLRMGHLHQQLDFSGSGESVIDYVCSAGGELPRILERIHVLEGELALDPGKENLLKEIGHLQSVYESLGGYDMKHLAAAALAGLGFREEVMERPMDQFSGGWQMRACMARTLLGEPDILLLDEPSNYLDIPAVEWLRKRLKSFQGTLLLVSHDRYLLNSLTDITLEVDNARVTRYSGNYTYYTKERVERRRHAQAAQENIDRERERLERNIERFRAKATKAAQVQSWIKMLDKMEDTELPDNLHFKGSIRIPDPPHSGAETVRLEDVTFSYDGTKNILEHVDLALNRGDKAAIVGYNGMGKTTLLKLIAGRLKPQSGNVVPGHKVIMGYQAQEFAELLTPDMTVFDIVREASAGTLPTQRIREILGSFGFSGDSVEKQCKVLSGGEKIRLCFARIFVNPPNFLLLDEPTTHLDIAAREALQQAINAFTGTVCLVSHDIEFVRGTAKTIIEMRSPGIRIHQGNYDYFMERLAAEQLQQQTVAKENETSSAESQKDRRRERAQKRQELSGEKRRLEKETAALEKIIDDADKEKKSIIDALSMPDEKTDYAALQKRIGELDKILEDASWKWEKSATALEEFMTYYNEVTGNTQN